MPVSRTVFLESLLEELRSFRRGSDRTVARFKYARELKDPGGILCWLRKVPHCQRC